MVRLLLKTARNDGVEFLRQIVPDFARSLEFFLPDSIGYFVDRRARERTLRCCHFIKDGPERKDVGPMIERMAQVCLLRAHIVDRSKDRVVSTVGLGLIANRMAGVDASQSKVEDLHLSSLCNHDVCRLDVA